LKRWKEEVDNDVRVREGSLNTGERRDGQGHGIAARSIRAKITKIHRGGENWRLVTCTRSLKPVFERCGKPTEAGSSGHYVCSIVDENGDWSMDGCPMRGQGKTSSSKTGKDTTEVKQRARRIESVTLGKVRGRCGVDKPLGGQEPVPSSASRLKSSRLCLEGKRSVHHFRKKPAQTNWDSGIPDLHLRPVGRGRSISVAALSAKFRFNTAHGLPGVGEMYSCLKSHDAHTTNTQATTINVEPPSRKGH
jgi:hypothetical protein